MKTFYSLIFIALIMLPLVNKAQQQVAVISRCGGTDTVTIPTIVDNDLDGMDDGLEQKLLDYFMPAIIQFSGENCPGPALDGTGDSNLIACHIYPVPQQYQLNNNLTSINTHPIPVVAPRSLTPGLVWYNPVVKINCAVLYGQDCGLLGHTADVEGFNFSLKYIGPDTVAGWMYDTVMTHWAGGTIQSVSHAGTPCEQVETLPYQMTVYASPNKHGNYLTISQCGASFICNPGCTGTQYRQPVKNVNIGEPNASLVSDLGNIYAPYIGNDPWSTTNFLNSHGGNAGAIRDKMLLDLSADFISGFTLTQPEICPLYLNCYGQTGSAYLHYSCAGSTYTFFSQQLTTPGTYYQTLTNSYGCDSIITLTLNFVNPDTTLLSATICSNNSYTFNNQPLNVTGIYTQTFTNQYGCDSMVILNLTVNPSDTSYISQAICPGSIYDFNGQQLSAVGLYSQTMVNQYSCDSTIILNLTYFQVDSTAITASICANATYDFYGQQLNTAGTFTKAFTNVAGCDSFVLLTLTILPTQNDTVIHNMCQGESYNGHSMAGTYVDSFNNTHGCDSLVTLLLAVDTIPTAPTLHYIGNQLSTDTAATYQWYLDSTAISGATNSHYVANVIGYYHVVITNSLGCAVSSDTVFISEVGISEMDLLNGVSIFPNPANDQIQITLPIVNNAGTYNIEILNILGVKVATTIKATTSSEAQLDLSQVSKGLYLIKIRLGSQQWVSKVVKQ